jgi:hypothetical protein
MARLDSRAPTRARNGRGISKPKNRRGGGTLGGLSMRIQFVMAASVKPAGIVLDLRSKSRTFVRAVELHAIKDLR